MIRLSGAGCLIAGCVKCELKLVDINHRVEWEVLFDFSSKDFFY